MPHHGRALLLPRAQAVEEELRRPEAGRFAGRQPVDRAEQVVADVGDLAAPDHHQVGRGGQLGQALRGPLAECLDRPGAVHVQRLLVAERGVEAQPGARQPSPELEVEDARKQGVAVVLDVEAAPDVDPRRSVLGQASTVTPRSIPSALGSPPRSVLAAPPERFVPEELGGTLLAAEHLARYWWASGAAAGADVLDAGCGVGFGTKLLVEAGARSATGVDIAEEAVAAARERCGERRDIPGGRPGGAAAGRRLRGPRRCASRRSNTWSGPST